MKEVPIPADTIRKMRWLFEETAISDRGFYFVTAAAGSPAAREMDA